jgi:hypothetical protein
VKRLFAHYHATDIRILGDTKRKALAFLDPSGRRIMCRNKVQSVVLPPIDIAERGVANSDRVLQHGCKYRLQIAGGAADNLQHLRRSSLLLKRLSEFARSLLLALEQSRVFDGDNGLVRKALNQLDLLVGERLHDEFVQDDYTDEVISAEHWHSEFRSDGINVA